MHGINHVYIHFFPAVSPYDPENCFNMSVLHKLEAVGIPVVTVLARNLTRLAKAGGVALDGLYLQDATVEHCVDMVIQNWQRPFTWSSLFEVLSELGQEDCSRQIEKYLASE